MIGGGLLARLALLRCDSVGEGPLLDGRPWIQNFGRIELGARIRIASRPIRTHLVTRPRAVLSLGDDVDVGHGVSIAAHARIRIGDRARIGPLVMIWDTNFHTVRDWRTGKPELRPVEIGADALLGEGVVVLPGSEVGAGAVVAPGSVVAGRIAPGSQVGGVPARAPRSAGPRPGTVTERIAAVLAETFGLTAPVPPGARPSQVAGWHTLGGLGLRLALEEEFGIEIPDAAWLEVRTAGDLARAVETGMAKGG